MQSTPALSRTWQATVHDRPFGEYWGTHTHTVTLTRAGQDIRAHVDGCPRDLREALLILRAASTLQLLAETPLHQVVA